MTNDEIIVLAAKFGICHPTQEPSHPYKSNILAFAKAVQIDILDSFILPDKDSQMMLNDRITTLRPKSHESDIERARRLVGLRVTDNEGRN